MAQGRFEIDSMCRSVNIPLYRPITGISSGRDNSFRNILQISGDTAVFFLCQLAMPHSQALMAPY